MTKSELIEFANNLNPCQVVVCETHVGRLYILINNALLSEDGYMSFINYDKTLIYNDPYDGEDPNYTIDKIYTYKCGRGFNSIRKSIIEEIKGPFDLVWERKEPSIELTMDEIARKFGVSVKNLKIKK